MKLLKLALYSVAAVFGLVVLWLTVGGMLAESRLDAARAGWETENGTIASFHQRHPKVEKNEAAKRLEVLAAAIGINIRPRSEGEVIQSDHPLVVEFKAATSELGNYLEEQLEKTSGPLDSVPTDTAVFLRAHRKEVVAIEDHLTAGALPTWKYDGAADVSMEIPNLLAHMQLSRLLSAHAVLALEEKSPQEAWHALHAMSRLGEALQPHPVLISQLIAAAIAKSETLLARHMPAPVPAWQMAVARRDRRRNLIDAVIMEQLFLDTAARNATLLGAARGNEVPRFVQLLTQPYAVACAADLWNVYKGVVSEIEKSDYCELDPKGYSQRHFASIGSWNFIGHQFYPNLGSAVVRVRDLEVAEEMTHKILEAKSSRMASAGAWPQSINGIEKCYCAKRSWKYSVSPDGTMQLALAPPFPQQEAQIVAIPFVYRER